ncbi:MAG: hypothetical protein ACHP9Y_03170 [Gammaproteobacteria bacterium]
MTLTIHIAVENTPQARQLINNALLDANINDHLVTPQSVSLQIKDIQLPWGKAFNKIEASLVKADITAITQDDATIKPIKGSAYISYSDPPANDPFAQLSVTAVYINQRQNRVVRQKESTPIRGSILPSLESTTPTLFTPPASTSSTSPNVTEPGATRRLSILDRSIFSAPPPASSTGQVDATKIGPG